MQTIATTQGQRGFRFVFVGSTVSAVSVFSAGAGDDQWDA
jgi:hypothetical protein